MEIEIVDPREGAAWDSLISQHRNATVFHTSGWARVLSKTYGHVPFYLQVVSGDRTCALLPMMEVRSRITGCRAVTLPFSDFCEPLVFEACEGPILLDAVRELGVRRGWKYLELRGRGDSELPCSPCGEFYMHRVDLRSDPDSLLASFGSSVRRAVRKAEKSGVIAEVSATREAVLDFYRLHVATRRRHGLPPQPRSFFLNIFDELIRTGHGFVASARLDSRIIAAAVFLRFDRRALFKFGASDDRLQSVRGNNLVMWRAFRHLLATGCDSVHLGRTSLESASLRRFKLGWGAEEEVLSYSTCAILHQGTKSANHETTGFHNAIFRRLPLAINRLAGALVYPHLD